MVPRTRLRARRVGPSDFFRQSPACQNMCEYNGTEMLAACLQVERDAVEGYHEPFEFVFWVAYQISCFTMP